MRKIVSSLCVIAVLAGMLCGCAVHDIPENTSDSGKGDMSIVSTSVAICRILDALEYDNVIGVPTTEKGIPERYDQATAVGGAMNPDLEIVRQLDADLVLSPKTLENALAVQYSNAGVPSAFLDLSGVEGMYCAITSLGKLLNREDQAAVLLADYESYMADYRQDKEEGPAVLLLMAFPDGFYLAASEDSYVGDLVRLAGGRNVYRDYQSDQEGFISINPENMVQKNPDQILVFAHYNEEAAFAYMEKEFAENSAWSHYPAVQSGRVAYLPSEFFGMSANLSWTDGVEYLEPILYPGGK